MVIWGSFVILGCGLPKKKRVFTVENSKFWSCYLGIFLEEQFFFLAVMPWENVVS